jgi:hypothetical protein
MRSKSKAGWDLCSTEVNPEAPTSTNNASRLVREDEVATDKKMKTTGLGQTIVLV